MNKISIHLIEGDENPYLMVLVLFICPTVRLIISFYFEDSNANYQITNSSYSRE